jgi:hypothetical protein
MTEDTGIWFGFQLAAEEVERRLGLTWGAAQKTLLELCESGAVRWQPVSHGYPNISSNDLRRCLQEKLTRKTGGKQPRIIALLRTMFPHGVPDRADRPREPLRATLVERDPSLHPLDFRTLKTAIELYNRQLGNARNTSVAD